MAEPTVILITGANRGIGKGVLVSYLSRPNTTVIAAVRDPNTASRTLSSIPKGDQSSLITIKIDSSSTTDAGAAISDLQSKHGIKKLDIVIANAGIADYYGPTATTPIVEFQRHLNINTIGVVVLFQAVLPLLTGRNPKFVALSTSVASITGADKMPLEAAAYGASKAAMNFIVRKIHRENESVISFPINPGWVQTDMGNSAAVGIGLDAAPNTLEESVNGIISVIDSSTREETSGEFMSFDKEPILW